MRKLIAEFMGMKIYTNDDPFYADKVIVDAGAVTPIATQITGDGIRTAFALRWGNAAIMRVDTHDASTPPVTVNGEQTS